MKYLTTPIITFFLFTSCITKTEKNTPDHSQPIDRLHQQFSMAYQTKDVDLISNLYSKDANNIPGCAQLPILEGEEAIRNTFASYFEQIVARGMDLDISFRIVNRQIGDSSYFFNGRYSKYRVAG